MYCVLILCRNRIARNLQLTTALIGNGGPARSGTFANRYFDVSKGQRYLRPDHWCARSRGCSPLHYDLKPQIYNALASVRICNWCTLGAATPFLWVAVAIMAQAYSNERALYLLSCGLALSLALGALSSPPRLALQSCLAQSSRPLDKTHFWLWRL